MFQPLELYVGLRYTRAKRRNHFISIISLISMLGIALGVMLLIVVLSVMNGFGEEVRTRILSVVSHATVLQAGGLRNWQEVQERMSGQPHVAGAAPYVDGEVMLNVGSIVRGALVRGVLPASEIAVSDLPRKMPQGYIGDLRAGEFGIVLGKELAHLLGVGVGDKVTLITPQAMVTPAGILPRIKRFNVVGVFDVGMYEYDSALALIHLQDAAKLFRLDEGTVSGLRLKLDDLDFAPLVRKELAAQLPPDFIVTDWSQQHANLFRAVQIEKRMMSFILALIIVVAAFNIVSTLVMTVTDKQSDIAILRTLGMTPRSVMTIFMVQGTVIGVVGTFLGVTGGVSLALNLETIIPAIEQFFGMSFMPSDVYQISELPSRIDWADVAVIAGTSMLMSVLATLYPAWRAARVQPAEALRYE